ncbi:UDP-N-acetylglucosamine 2-epimerase (non-hydrolyzing) [Psychroflexus gondwanensis]|jgi:UDP-N-acetylglucosamine 2-epimerase (non-hydrolysing)|uniref:UDP-N-acetylglucosamine 2-epimerase (non-hydrolyzing) n=1 Tax=Psychroflexus gondwanensis ACAM 44 TaxID=1189619 RepID=N1WIU7_9FLAO|nr:UDP-N-acetylglucosamine 2-epimerase (non-hydrolyzing) [Psychroflexus gondwanensis]EMY80181.1 UDP-N-acetylglucosamine 2-epimerase [Psychroflexus gondwanensis ACAM 44]TXE18486.1 UDP-N-acetylglucosamine 2-epimerase (non-hydrolyzing) [Psychroflexus gondwanensis]
MIKIKNLIIFGTRPEAIKMAPLVKAFEVKQNSFETKVCITAQHREMLDQVLDFFEIKPDFDLDLMKANQNLFSLTSDIINTLKPVLEEFQPDYVYVHGDTTTTMAASIAAFYSGAKVCHIEAGLRTFDKRSPFPEEMNRSVAGRIADYHFCPTETSKNNLLNENIDSKNILVTGNTVIDALKYSNEKVNSKNFNDREIDSLKAILDAKKQLVLVTGHRRENHGQGFINICNALKQIAEENEDVQIIYPVHLNPKVQKPVYNILKDVPNISLIDPLSYPSFIWLMSQSYIIITDSGGVQEEAPSLGKPVLVMRDTTERPEAVEAGTVLLVGTNTDKIVFEANRLLEDNQFYTKMCMLHNPYGDGMACKRIVEFIKKL